MKTLGILTLAFGFALSATACNELSPVQGQVTLPAGQGIHVKDKHGKEMPLSEGSLAARLEYRGVISGASLVVKSGGDTYEFAIPRRAYLSGGKDFKIRAHATDGSVIVIAGHASTGAGSTKDEMAKVSCESFGYCCRFGGIEAGSSVAHDKYGCSNFMNCEGTQKVIQRTTETTDSYEVDFVSAENSNKVFAHFSGSAPVERVVETIKKLSGCDRL
jgi:hypothetical protein